MPVSRNCSLPSSIEGRKFKKRPGELQCLIMPSANKNWNCNNNNDPNVNQTCSSTNQSSSSAISTAQRSSSPKVTLACRSRSSAARITLSHPCVSDTQTVGATTIFPHLFLGSQQDVIDENLMRENNITNVLNVSSNCARPKHLDDEHFHRIAVRDNYQERITPHFEEAIQFIESIRRKNEKVLVHCLAGVSRSATVAIAYVMYYLRLSFDDAYRFVKDKRPTISPNFNFLGQLMEYEKVLRDQDHFAKPRTGSIHDDVTTDYFSAMSDPGESKTTSTNTKSTVYKNVKLETSFLSKSPLTPRSTPSSALFCRRRNNLNQAGDNLPPSGFKQRCAPNAIDGGGAGVILDLQVSVPHESHSRRLGSDGLDEEEEEGIDEMSSTYKSNSLPRNLTRLVGRMYGNESCMTPEMLSRRICEKQQVRIRSFTAPSTPAGHEFDPFSRGDSQVQRLTAIERLFPRDVEMLQSEEEKNKTDDSPPSPARTTNRGKASLYLASEDSYASSVGSVRTDKIASRKSKSPKVTKKSFSSGVRPPYYQALRNSKHLGNTYSNMPQRIRAKDPLNLKIGSIRSLSTSYHCESPGTEGISSLTLYSPVVVDSNPLEVVGRGLSSTDKDFSSTSLAPTAGHQAALEPNNLKSKIGSPFQLASSTDLKLKWRKRSPRTDLHSENAGVSREQSQSPSVLSRPCSGSVGIISCS